MNYLLNVKLCGFICDERSEPLSSVIVRLYSRTDDNTAYLATANPKHTFARLTEKQVKEKAPFLLAEGVTDEAGNVDLSLDDKYNGEALDVDIQINGSAGENEEQHAYCFHITTITPAWRKVKDRWIAYWKYCLPRRIWCRILALLGRWIICGKVVHCQTQQPIGGVDVFAFDCDWVQHDPLGSARTDSNGYFFIEYTMAAFIPGTWLDIELFGGPDVYFHILHPSGMPLLTEPPAKGRQPGRENVGHCFCVELCLDKDVEVEEEYPPPVFTHVGGYNHQTQIDSGLMGNGLTTASDRAFFRNIRLNGTLPKKIDGVQTEYRFEIREVRADGTVITPWAPIGIGQIERTEIGALLNYAPAFPGDPNPIKSRPYTVNGHAGELRATDDGVWIQVPQESSTFGTDGFFQPNGNQIVLNTVSIGGWTDVDLTGLDAGDSSTSTGKPLAQNRYFGLQMKVRKVGIPASEVTAGVCEKIAINNTLYDNILRHPVWMPENVSDQLCVAMVDIDQLVMGGGCAKIQNALDVKFTAAHPTLGNVSIRMTGPGGPYSFTLPAAVPGERFGTATPNGFVVADLKPCAYIVRLRVQVLLTDGDRVPNDRYDQIAFCKG